MKIDITGHHVEVTDSLRDYVNVKMDRVERHFDIVSSAHVILSVEKTRQKAEATLSLKGSRVFAESTEEDMYAAIDSLVDKLDRQVKKHKEKIVIFSHKKHQDEYQKKHSEFFENGCGECHHDENNKPLVDLKDGDDVKRCIECHKKPEYAIGRKVKGLSKEEKREFHANAMHDNCKGCHRKYNKKNKLKSKSKGYAPNSCKTCHP